jgi:hypothetical protein
MVGRGLRDIIPTHHCRLHLADAARKTKPEINGLGKANYEEDGSPLLYPSAWPPDGGEEGDWIGRIFEGGGRHTRGGRFVRPSGNT